jgi:hypothetical protein
MGDGIPLDKVVGICDEQLVNECRTTLNRRAIRSQWKHCSCGCGGFVLLLQEFLSPDGVRWVLSNEQNFMDVGTNPRCQKKSVDMESMKA